MACASAAFKFFRWGVRLWFLALFLVLDAWYVFSAVSWRASSIGIRSCIISSLAVGAFFQVGVSIIVANLFIRPSLWFFEIVCMLCAHTTAA